jgi:hypothetical protein
MHSRCPQLSDGGTTEEQKHAGAPRKMARKRKGVLKPRRLHFDAVDGLLGSNSR